MTFKQTEGDTVVLVCNGIYKPADLYDRNGQLFARYNGGYIRLKANGTTSRDKIRFEEMECDELICVDVLGRLWVGQDVQETRTLYAPTKPLLLE